MTIWSLPTPTFWRGENVGEIAVRVERGVELHSSALRHVLVGDRIQRHLLVVQNLVANEQVFQVDLLAPRVLLVLVDLED